MARWCRCGLACWPALSVAGARVSHRAPFPPPARRAGQADFPRPALGQGLTPSPRGRGAVVPPETVRQSAPSGLERASRELQVVTWEWLETDRQIGFHLAQMRQVDTRRQQNFQPRQTIWPAMWEGSFPFQAYVIACTNYSLVSVPPGPDRLWKTISSGPVLMHAVSMTGG